MKKLEFIGTLSESKMFKSKYDMEGYALQEVSDNIFLHILALTILIGEGGEYKEFAEQYLKDTIKWNDFESFRFSATDLYVLLHMIESKVVSWNPESGITHIEKSFMIRGMQKIATDVDSNTVSVFLFKLDQKLRVTNPEYKAARRVVVEWDIAQEGQKKRVVTRILWALRHDAKKSEVLEQLEKMAIDHKLKDKLDIDPETGDEI